MGYIQSLIKRKFKDIGEKQYDKIRIEYAHFLVTEEELEMPEIKKILLPVDIFANDISDKCLDVLKTFDSAEISLIYLIDEKVTRIVGDIIGKDQVDIYVVQHKESGQRVIDNISSKIQNAGMKIKSSLYVGKKEDEIIRLSGNADLLVISRDYGEPTSELVPVSPLAQDITRRASTPVILY
jgi:hypothetical protein